MLAALRNVIDPDFGEDVVNCGFVKDLTVRADGAVSFTLELTTPACPVKEEFDRLSKGCLLYTSPSPRDQRGSRMPSSA